jgi:hypothetical protein
MLPNAFFLFDKKHRYKKTEETLRDIVSSFRVYSVGLNFSDELMQYSEM